MNYIKRYFYRKKRDSLETETGVEIKDTDLRVDQLSTKPQKAWLQRRGTTKVQKVTSMDPASPIRDDVLRVVCVADSHGRLEKAGTPAQSVVPHGDVLLHAGDFSMYGSKEEIMSFNSHFGCLPHPVKIVIAGNHDMMLDTMAAGSEDEADVHRKLLTNFIYLQDAMVDVCGVNVYGSPWVPICGTWGFTLPRGIPLLRRWTMIPNDVDILMTHGPPLGYGDTVFDGHHVGCVDLLNTIQQRVRPKYYINGHIHEGYGIRTDGSTCFINAAMCTKRYRPVNPPIVFDFPIPQGHSKSELQQVKCSERLIVRDLSNCQDERPSVAADFMRSDAKYGESDEEEEGDEEEGDVVKKTMALEEAGGSDQR